MREALTISELAKRSRVPSKTIRFWEEHGLLPKAARTHTGYRVFHPDSLRYVAFIRKSKAIGLTLAEMREILRLSRTGHCPCPEIGLWTEEKQRAAEDQMRSLAELIERLKRIRKQCSVSARSHKKCGDVCYLIEELPEGKTFTGGTCNEKAMDRCERCCRGVADQRVAGDRGSVRVLSSRLPALPLQVSRRSKPKRKAR